VATDRPSSPARSRFGPPTAPQSSSHGHLEMMRRVTRGMAAVQELPAVLSSIASALVEHTGAVVARVFLYRADEECETCRARGPAAAESAGGERCLHLSASAGAVPDTVAAAHRIPLSYPAPPAQAARERRPLYFNDLATQAGDDPAMWRVFQQLGAVAAGAHPLEFRGELLGVIGMLSPRRFHPQEFALLGIFADQAAMAIKNAYLFEELARYKDRLEGENAYLQDEIRTERGFDRVVGQSASLKGVLRKVQQVAAVETTVLLTGETGTGKELIARAIHALSPRERRPLIKVNCGAIPHGLVESELFGHERGAFTGALQRRIGRFELADRGTLFMDEVGELPPDTQVKLLRVLQEQEFERLGGTRPIQVDVRLVAATNRDLELEVAEGRFRADLFYRLNVFPVRIPPLRERPGDVPRLVQHFLAHFQRKLAKPLRALTPESMARLERYAWPGNIRELQNVIERSCVLATGPVVEVAEALGQPDGFDDGGAHAEPIVTLEEHERTQIRRALAVAAGRIHGPGGAAALLGVNGSTLRSRMRKLGVAKRGS
jgi:formate hydrogenlyase transcriptional activator